jgi:hypothetical protein
MSKQGNKGYSLGSLLRKKNHKEIRDEKMIKILSANAIPIKIVDFNLLPAERVDSTF